jgi:hypothetical protein
MNNACIEIGTEGAKRRSWESAHEQEYSARYKMMLCIALYAQCQPVKLYNACKTLSELGRYFRQSWRTKYSWIRRSGLSSG